MPSELDEVLSEREAELAVSWSEVTLWLKRGQTSNLEMTSLRHRKI